MSSTREPKPRRTIKAAVFSVTFSFDARFGLRSQPVRRKSVRPCRNRAPDNYRKISTSVSRQADDIGRVIEATKEILHPPTLGAGFDLLNPIFSDTARITPPEIIFDPGRSASIAMRLCSYHLHFAGWHSLIESANRVHLSAHFWILSK